MVKKLNCYEGNVILGYRFVLPKLPIAGYVKRGKITYRPVEGKNNTLKCVKAVRRTFKK